MWAGWAAKGHFDSSTWSVVLASPELMSPGQKDGKPLSRMPRVTHMCHIKFLFSTLAAPVCAKFRHRSATEMSST